MITSKDELEKQGIVITDLALNADLQAKSEKALDKIAFIVKQFEKETGLKFISLSFDWKDEGLGISPIIKGNISHT